MKIEVFTTGTHTSANGIRRTWSASDLQTIADKYNNQGAHEAPVVIGHPADNAPAYGWVKSLSVEGNSLFAELDQLDPTFVGLVQAGRYKKRSIALYPDLTLRHIGFLGAMPPALKGLADVQFNEGEAELYDFADPTTNNLMDEQALAELQQDIAQIRTALQQLVQALTGQQQQGQQPPQQQGQQQAPPQRFSEEEENELVTLRRKVMISEFNEYLATPELAKRIPQAERADLVEQMLVLSSVGNYEFSDGKTESALDRFKKTLEKRPALTEFSEIAKKGEEGENATQNQYVQTGSEIAKY